jgi:hypothetical protein
MLVIQAIYTNADCGLRLKTRPCLKNTKAKKRRKSEGPGGMLQVVEQV